MEHSLQITLTKEGTDLLTSAGSKFGLWKMVEKKSKLVAKGGLMEATTSSTTLIRTSQSSISV